MINMKELYWCAGFMEGEGSFLKNRTSISVVCSQVIIEPLERLQKLFGGNIVYIDRTKHKSYNPKHKNYYLWQLHGAYAAGVMLTLFTLMSERRQEQITKCMLEYNVIKPPKNGYSGRTHCMQGHEYTVENTYLKTNGRQCRECMRIYRANYFIRKKQNENTR